jgi:hypothetical protein
LRDCLENPARLDRTRVQADRLQETLRQPTEGDAAAWLAAHLPSVLR